MNTKNWARLRYLRAECHQIFDRYWTNGKSRRAAYLWLQAKLNLHAQLAHFSKLNEKQCLEVLRILKEEIKTENERQKKKQLGHPENKLLYLEESGQWFCKKCLQHWLEESEPPRCTR